MRMQLEEDMFQEEEISHIMRFRGCSYESAKMEYDVSHDEEEDYSDED